MASVDGDPQAGVRYIVAVLISNLYALYKQYIQYFVCIQNLCMEYVCVYVCMYVFIY